MATVLSDYALFDESEAKRFLRDQGFAPDNDELLRLHINGVSGFILRYTGRQRLKYSATSVLEIRNGRDIDWMYTKEAPIKSLLLIETYPFESNVGEAIVGPLTSVSNDDMWYESESGRITLLNRTFPEGYGAVRLTYQAGWYDDGDAGAGEPADPALSQLKLLGLEVMLRKWQRWVEKRVGVSSRSHEGANINYERDDFSTNVLKELDQYKRTMVM